jgi:hypothetical protein
MGSKKFFLVGTALVALILVLLMPAMAGADTKSVYWERLDVQIEVMKNGDFRVTETQQIRFNGGPFHHGYREFSTSFTTGVTDVSITDDEGRTYSASTSGQPYTFKTAQSNGKFRIDWYFPSRSNFTKTWKISYVVHGGLYFYPKSTNLQWTAVFSHRAGVVKSSKITVLLPDGTQPLQVVPFSKSHNVKVVSSQGNKIILESTAELSTDDYISVLVSWKSGVVQGTPAPWQLRHDRWQQVNGFDAALTMHKNGDLDVTETMEVYLSGGPYTYFTRSIPLWRIDSVGHISVKMDGRECQLENASGNEHTTYSFTTKKVNNDLEIRVFFPPTSYARHTFTLSYTAHGVVWYGKELDMLKWRATPYFPDSRTSILSSLVQISFPPEVNLQSVSVNLADATVKRLDAHTVRISTGKIASDTALKLDVRWPHGEIGGSKPAWQIEEEKNLERLRRKARIKSILGMFSILLAIAGGLLSYLLWLLGGKEPKVALPTDYLNEPPEDASPALVGVLLRNRVTRDELFGAILKLAQGGFLKIKEVAGDEGNFEIVRLKDPKEATSVLDRMLMELLFRDIDFGALMKMATSTGFFKMLKGGLQGDLAQKFSGGSLSEKRLMSEVVPQFPGFQKKIAEVAIREAIQRGYFKSDPRSVQKKISSIGTFTFIAGLLLLIFAGGVFPGVEGIYIALMVIGFVVWVAGNKWSVMAPKGADMKARWLAFKRYLGNIDQYVDIESAKGLFEKFLPYAVAFGLKKDFVEKFLAVGTPVPSWWATEAPVMPEDIGDFSEVGTGATPGGGGAGHVHEAPLPGAGHEGGLEGASSHAMGGLDSMSDKLFSLFDTAASSPSPSGYSGGGSSDFGGSDWDSGGDDDWGDFDDDSSGGFD